jgi:hypothetical protein
VSVAAELIGMDPQRVGGIQSTLKGQVDSLESLSDSISKARLASVTPLAYGVPSGALVVAPHSIAAVTNAIAHLKTARANAQSLVAGLSGEINQQQTASAVSTGSSNKGESRKGFEGPAAVEPFDKGFLYYGYSANALTVFDRAKGVATLKKAMPKSGLKDWTDDWDDLKAGKSTVATKALASDEVFSDVDKVAKVVNDTPVGKVLGVVGVGFSAYDAVQDFSQGKVGDGIADSVEAGLGIAALVTPPPADLVLGAAALAVGLGQLIADNHVAIGKAIGKAASTVASVTNHLANGVVDVEKNIGKGLVSAIGSLF